MDGQSRAVNSPMKEPPDKDWLFAVVLTGLVVLALVVMMLDPSCHHYAPVIPTR